MISVIHTKQEYDTNHAYYLTEWYLSFIIRYRILFIQTNLQNDTSYSYYVTLWNIHTKLQHLKAFDKGNHAKLLPNLHYHGIQSQINNWFESFPC